MMMHVFNVLLALIEWVNKQETHYSFVPMTVRIHVVFDINLKTYSLQDNNVLISAMIQEELMMPTANMKLQQY